MKLIARAALYCALFLCVSRIVAGPLLNNYTIENNTNANILIVLDRDAAFNLALRALQYYQDRQYRGLLQCGILDYSCCSWE